MGLELRKPRGKPMSSVFGNNKGTCRQACPSTQSDQGLVIPLLDCVIDSR